MNIRYCTRSALLAAALLLPTAAMAAQTTNDLNVSITITASCTVNAATVAFGTHDGDIVNYLYNTVDLTVNCTPGTTYTLGFNPGSNHDGFTRRMENGGDYVKYDLYKDSGHTLALDTATNVFTHVDTPPLTVYGRVEGSQTPPVGTYTDTVVMTLTY